MSNPNLVRKIANSPTGSAGEIDNSSVQALLSTNKNLIINGAMEIDQRFAGGAISAANTDNKYLVDRWYAGTGGSMVNKFNSGQNQLGFTPPAGFSKYFNFNCIGSTTPVGSDTYLFFQEIEGHNIPQLAWGTSEAKAVTLSFWVRSTITGNHGGVVKSGNALTGYPFLYQILSPNTWEYKTISIPGPTTGTWLTTNGIGIYVCFSLGTGPTLSGPTGAWLSGTNYNSANGAVNVAVNGANWNITGVQLNEGELAAPFERRPFEQELELCKRYFQKTYHLNTPVGAAGTSGAWSAASDSGASSHHMGTLWFQPAMRLAPTVTGYNAVTGGAPTATPFTDGAGGTPKGISVYGISEKNILAHINGTTGAGLTMYGHFTFSAEFT